MSNRSTSGQHLSKSLHDTWKKILSLCRTGRFLGKSPPEKRERLCSLKIYRKPHLFGDCLLIQSNYCNRWPVNNSPHLNTENETWIIIILVQQLSSTSGNGYCTFDRRPAHVKLLEQAFMLAVQYYNRNLVIYLFLSNKN